MQTSMWVRRPAAQRSRSRSNPTNPPSRAAQRSRPISAQSDNMAAISDFADPATGDA